MKKLIGIGVGPGDPELMTYKAIKIIKSSDLVFVPIAKSGQSSVALEIAKEYITHQRIIPLIFPMIKSMEKRNKYMKRNIDVIIKYLSTDKKSVFLTIGDPSVYATYMYLVERLKKSQVTIETLPGISSFSAICSKANLPIALNDENFTVYPLKNDLESIKDIIHSNDNVIFMKVSKGQKSLYQALKETNHLENCLVASNIGKADEIITRNINILLEEKLSYFTTLVLKKGGIHE